MLAERGIKLEEYLNGKSLDVCCISYRKGVYRAKGIDLTDRFDVVWDDELACFTTCTPRAQHHIQLIYNAIWDEDKELVRLYAECKDFDWKNELFIRKEESDISDNDEITLVA